MKSKLLLSTSVLAMVSLLGACQTQPTTAEFAEKAEKYMGDLGKFGQTIKSVGPETHITCACTPKIGPDKIPNPQPPRSKEETKGIEMAIQMLTLLLKAESAGEQVEVSSTAAAATTAPTH
jgi:hypothetical protein